jgi:hypothetical protein
LRAFALAAALALASCAHDNARLEALQKLDVPSKDLLSKYRQFLTPLQIDRFLGKEDFEKRDAYLKSLKIEERIAHYPPAVQQAIWNMDIIAGMDKPAVLMTWGSPENREIDEGKADQGVEYERWGYDRASARFIVVIVNGYVTEVIEQKK